MGKYKSKTLIWFHLFFRVLRSMHIVKLVLLLCNSLLIYVSCLPFGDLCSLLVTNTTLNFAIFNLTTCKITKIVAVVLFFFNYSSLLVPLLKDKFMYTISS